MKTNRVTFTFAISALALAALACNLGAAAPEPPDVDAMATSVAATVAAMDAGAETPAGDEPAEEVESETPAEPAILRVAYTDSDLNLWYWEEGAAPRQLTDTGDIIEIKISHDGTLIAFLRGADYANLDLWVIRSDGSGERRLVSAAEFASLTPVPDSVGTTAYGLVWVPGEHTLAFTTQPLFEGPGFMLNNDLWLVNAETGERRMLLAPGSGGMFTYSPDGTQIVLVTPTEVSLVNADGSNRRHAVLTYAAVMTYSDYAYHVQPVWAQDSSYLRVVVPPQDPLASSPRPPTAIWHLPAAGTGASQIATLDVFFLDPVVLSPDLQRLAYLRPLAAEVSDNQRELRIAAANGSADTLYASGDSIRIYGWSPDSEHFIFSINGFTNMQLGRVGSGFVPLAESGYAVLARWVAGERFLYLTMSGDNWELRLGTIGTPSTLIAGGSGNPMQLQVSYDFSY